MGCWGWIVDSVSRGLAFCPPSPSTYEVAYVDDSPSLDNNCDVQGTPMVLKSPQPLALKVKKCNIQLFNVQTRPFRGCRSTRIIVAWVPYQGAPGHGPTILYSHPNALDLGQCLPFCIELSKILAVNVMAYDYTGYGASEGRPSVRSSQADILAAFDLLVHRFNKTPSDVLLYGQSLGTGPTVFLAAGTPGFAGIVLHSGMLSGVRVLKPSIGCWPRWADIYPNCHLIKQVGAPTWVMHGTEDEVICIDHGKKLHELAKNPFDPPLWASGFNHQNLDSCPQFVPMLKKFCSNVFDTP